VTRTINKRLDYNRADHAWRVSIVFSMEYEPYRLSQSLSIFNFEYTHKPYDQAIGFYYYDEYYDNKYKIKHSCYYDINDISTAQNDSDSVHLVVA
jgi:hypothetical protein